MRVIFVEVVINIGEHNETVHKNVTDTATLPPKPPKYKKEGNIQRKKRLTITT